MKNSQKLVVSRAFDGSEIKTLVRNTQAEVGEILDRASALHDKQPGGLPVWQRIEILKNLTGLMRAEIDDLAMTIALEGGKPLQDARVEADRAVLGVELAIAGLMHQGGHEIPMDISPASAGKLAFTTKEPIGVVVAVSAFNHPLNLIVHQVIPAVATGCPVIVKPAATTPLSCLRLVELLAIAGLPPGWCQTCLCDNAVAEKLITDPKVAFFSFIGSSRVGWYLHSKLAPGTRAALEHGGVAPVIVTETADFDAMIPKLVKGGYYHAGQVCVSVQRIFVDDRIKADFADAFKQQVEKLKVGDPALTQTEVGPLISTHEVGRVESWVKDAIDGGANCTAGGHRLSEHVYAPTILLDPAPDANVSTDEIFGPVTCIYGYTNAEDAVNRANSLSVAFQAAVFSAEIAPALNIAKGLDASAVMINDHSAFRTDWMPFAGRKSSGLGIGGIANTMEDMCQSKMIVFSD